MSSAMWRLETRTLTSGLIGAAAFEGGVRMTFSQVIFGWRTDESFVAEWVARVAEIPFDAYCFETPPLTKQMLAEPFECVFVDSPLLARQEADSQPFQEHFRNSHGSVAFQSLGKDALLVAPCPVNESTCYTHLAAFLRSASKEEARDLWRTVAQGLEERLADAPIWLSTAGLGVSWLHVRLDTRPKYYRHRSYASPHYWTAESMSKP
jgi:hypothetical protein